jgi:hypothetical protein
LRYTVAPRVVFHGLPKIIHVPEQTRVKRVVKDGKKYEEDSGEALGKDSKSWESADWRFGGDGLFMSGAAGDARAACFCRCCC